MIESNWSRYSAIYYLGCSSRQRGCFKAHKCNRIPTRTACSHCATLKLPLVQWISHTSHKRRLELSEKCKVSVFNKLYRKCMMQMQGNKFQPQLCMSFSSSRHFTFKKRIRISWHSALAFEMKMKCKTQDLPTIK